MPTKRFPKSRELTGSHKHSDDAFARMSELDFSFVRSINHNPWLHTDDEHENYAKICDDYGYYYSFFNGVRKDGQPYPMLYLSGPMGPYLPYLLSKRIPIILREGFPIHNTAKALKPRYLICCGDRLPENSFYATEFNIVLFDHPHKQTIYTQINTPNPTLTSKIFWELIFLGEIKSTFQLEIT